MAEATVELPKILVASDLSDQAALAVERAFVIAHETGAEVAIAHIVDESLPTKAQSFEATTSDHLIRSKIASLPHASEVRVTIDIVTGRPDVDIAERAEIEGAGLVLVGLHNRLLEENLPIEGTIDEDIIRTSSAPVLLVKDKPRGPYRTVIIGVDFSAYSRLAMRTAIRIAPNADIHLVHAFHASSPRPLLSKLSDSMTHGPLAAADRRRLEIFVEQEMAILRNAAPSEGLLHNRLHSHSREGYPHDIIKHEAQRLGADLIVLGTHGRIGLQRTLLGSVSTDVINDRICDVLVVRPY